MGRRWVVLAVLCGVQFTLFIGGTIVMVSLPAIRADLQISESALQWVVTSYVVTFGGLLLVGGRLVDVLGGRALLLTGLALFTVSSLGCALSSEGWVLITFRALQGVAAAMASPAALSLLAASFATPRARRLALGVWAAAGAIGSALGNAIGGLITTVASWHWIFLLILPAMVLLLAGSIWVLPRMRPVHHGPVGIWNALVVTATVALLLLVVTRLPQLTPDSLPWTALALLAVLVLGGLFWLLERRSSAPLLPRRHLRGQPAAGYLLVLLGSSGMGIYYLCSIYMQDTLGFTALQAGLLFLPWSFAIAGGAQLASWLLARHSPRALTSTGILIMLAGLGLLAMLLGPEMRSAVFLLPYMLIGLGQGMVGVISTNVALSASRAGDHGVAASLVNSSQQVGGALFIGLVGATAIFGSQLMSDRGWDLLAADRAGAQMSLAVAMIALVGGLCVSLFGLRAPRIPITAAVRPASADALEVETDTLSPAVRLSQAGAHEADVPVCHRSTHEGV